MGKYLTVARRLPAVIPAILVGALCGLVLAAFGSVISGSTLAVIATVAASTALGAWLNRLPGGLIGAVCGMMLVAFGSLTGGSALGVGLTVAGCALAGGWLQWNELARNEPHSESRESGDSQMTKPLPVVRRFERTTCNGPRVLDTRPRRSGRRDAAAHVRVRVCLRQSLNSFFKEQP